MFGDDPDPTVTTERVGFGEVLGRAQEGFDKRETQTRLVSKRSTKARGDAATTSGYGFYENIWMRCT